jgi:hypothetical protein
MEDKRSAHAVTAPVACAFCCPSTTHRRLAYDNARAPAPDATLKMTAPSPLSLEETLAPVRDEFAQSGLTDADLTALVEEVRETIRQEKQTPSVTADQAPPFSTGKNASCRE